MCAQGRLEGALIIPPQFSRRFYAGENPQLGMVVDNSDQFMSASLENKMQELVTALNQPEATAKRISTDVALEIIELYPYIEYMKYLLPGAITLAMFVSVMIGGGMLYIDDKARGVHEGYLVTPITASGDGSWPQSGRSDQGHHGRMHAHGSGLADCGAGLVVRAERGCCNGSC